METQDVSKALKSYYLAPISYYKILVHNRYAGIDVEENYVKQTFRNHCVIDSPNGALKLTIPVTGNHKPTPMKDILISDHNNWRHQHWNALASSYSQTPYFEYYADDFYPFYHEKKWERLVDFNQELQELVLRLLNLPPDLSSKSTVPDHNTEKPLPPTRPYYQIFASKHGFIPDLSIVDLLFNMGPESILYL